MTVRMYSSLDAGAPVLPNVSGQRFLDNLKLILKACLVDGYTGKPAAGWTLAHEHADGISFSNGEGVITFVYGGGVQGTNVYLMEEITDGSTALPTGVNRRSGPWYEGSPVTQRAWFNSYLYGTQPNKGWVLVADEATVYLMVQTGTISTADAQYHQANAIYFGRFYPVGGGVGFCALGTSSGNSAISHFLRDTSQAGTVLRHPLTNLSDQGVDPTYRALGLTLGSAALENRAPDKVSPRVVQFSRALMGGGGVGVSGSTQPSSLIVCGHLRGLMVDQALGSTYLTPILQRLGVATPNGTDRLKAVPIGSKSFVPAYLHTSDLGGFFSLDEADWTPLWS